MEPPTCTVLVRLVRTAAAVATWPLSPDGEVMLLSLPPAATATPPPTRAPAMAAMTTTCLAENSAIGTRPGVPARFWEGVVHSGRPDFDVSRCIRAIDPPGWRAYLLAAQVVDPHDGWTVGVDAGSVEIGLVPVGIGVVRDPVGPHAGDVLQELGLIRRRRDRVGGPQLVRGLSHVLAAGAGTFVEIPGRLGVFRDVDVDHPARADGWVGLIRITVAALAGRPLVQQRGHVARDRGPGAPATAGGARAAGARDAGARDAGAGSRAGAGPRAGPQAGDLRGRRRAAARG